MAAITDANPPKPDNASGLLSGVLEGQDADDDDDEQYGHDVKMEGEPVNGELLAGR